MDKCLNYYIEFPHDFDENTFTHGDRTWLPLTANIEVCKNIVLNNKDIEFCLIDTREIESKRQPFIPNAKYNKSCVIIENPDNKKYFVLSYLDKLSGILYNNTWDLENCVEIFACFGVHENDLHYKPIDIKYTPSTYTTVYLAAYYEIERLYKLKNERRIFQKPFFISSSYGIRDWIRINDNRIDYINERLDPVSFIRKFDESMINIDINGVAEISTRTLDAMGLGTVLIRPKLTCQFHNKLIPDYHYAEVKCDDVSNLKSLVDSYIDRYNEVQKDKDFMMFLSTNGRKWYEENTTIEGNVNVFSKIIDLNKLFD